MSQLIYTKWEMFDIYEAALKEIALGRGPFKIDPLEHAGSCIETMKEIAERALRLEYDKEGL